MVEAGTVKNMLISMQNGRKSPSLLGTENSNMLWDKNQNKLIKRCIHKSEKLLHICPSHITARQAVKHTPSCPVYGDISTL